MELEQQYAACLLICGEPTLPPHTAHPFIDPESYSQAMHWYELTNPGLTSMSVWDEWISGYVNWIKEQRDAMQDDTHSR